MPNHKFQEKSTYYDDFQRVRTKVDAPAAGRSLADSQEELSIAQSGEAGEWEWPVTHRSKSLPKGGGDGKPAGQKHLSVEYDVHTLGQRKINPLLTPRDHPGSVMVVCTAEEKDQKAPAPIVREKAAGRPQLSHLSGAILGFSAKTGFPLKDKKPLPNALQPDISPIVPNEDANGAQANSAYRMHFAARPGVGPEPGPRPKPPESPRARPKPTQSQPHVLNQSMATTMPLLSEPTITPRPHRLCRPVSNPRSGPVPGGFSGPANGIDEWSTDEPRGPKVPLPETFHNYPWRKVDNFAAKTYSDELAKLQTQTLRDQARLRSELDQQVAGRRKRMQREQAEEKRFHAHQEMDVERFKEDEANRVKALKERVRLTQKELDAQVREVQKREEASKIEKVAFERKMKQENEVIQKGLKEAAEEKERKRRAELAKAWQSNLGAQADQKARKKMEKAEDQKTAAMWGKILAHQDDLRVQNREDRLRKHAPLGGEPCSRPSAKTKEGRLDDERTLQERKALEERDRLEEEAKMQRARAQREDVAAFNKGEMMSRSGERQRQKDKKEEIRSAVDKKALVAKQAADAEKASVRAKSVAHRHDLETQIKSRPPPAASGVMSEDEARLNRRLLGIIESSKAG